MHLQALAQVVGVLFVPSASTKPVIFISYSHKDEPEKPRQDEIQWLSFVRTYLHPAVKHGVFDLWVDRHMPGGADWNPDIETKLRACDIFMLLVWQTRWRPIISSTRK